MWREYHTPTSLEDAVQLLAENRGRARILAGATDLLLEMERGVRRGIEVLIDITRIPGLDWITQDEKGWVRMGALVTHNHCVASPLIRSRAFCLARACWEVGAPQIRNRGTIAGNLITASPANDSIPPLMALGAVVRVRSARGEREIPLDQFYQGVRRTALQDDEVLTQIAFPLPPETARSTFRKHALRRAQAISVVDVAVVVDLAGGRIERAAISLGAVAPIIVRVPEAEEYLAGKELTAEVIEQAAARAANAARPIDDLRGSAVYRAGMVRVQVRRALEDLAAGRERDGFPDRPILLWGPEEWHVPSALAQLRRHDAGTPIVTTLNGVRRTIFGGQDKTLLRFLREDAGLTGTKEGCAEGECGACTVFLDGMAVMACMVPAPRADGAEIVTVEGLAPAGVLHPVQQAFLEEGAVQCGYCTPGLLMSGAMLLREEPQPTRSDMAQAITGNLCRCTGYYKILAAMERAARRPAQPVRPAVT